MAEVTSFETLEGEAGDVMGVGFTVNALLDWINRIIVNFKSAMVMRPVKHFWTGLYLTFNSITREL